jgi:GGDEF domain-containing protein
MLRQAASRMNTRRSSDLPARIGGDEFVLIIVYLNAVADVVLILDGCRRYSPGRLWWPLANAFSVGDALLAVGVLLLHAVSRVHRPHQLAHSV